MKIDISTLTLEEKLRLLTGKDAWRTYDANGKISSVFVSDGPHGLRKVADNGETVKATAMPNLSTVANGWSREAAYLDGRTIADECIKNDVDVILAPGVNIKRTPLCGRNFEYLSEDPFLAGTLAKEYIAGVQSKGVGTSLKHFCANNCEEDRLSKTSEIDERTLKEIYLTAFEIALSSKPWTVMCAYNLINGVYASENKYLLKDILRDEFGFDGVVVSDWGAVQSGFRRMRAGLDLEMPFRDHSYDDLKKAYDKGLIDDEMINTSVEHILKLVEKAKNAKKKVEFTDEERHENAVKIAEEGIVLLKNDDGILPLNPGTLNGGAGLSGNVAVERLEQITTAGGVLIIGDKSVNPPLGGGGSAYVETAFKQRDLKSLLKDKMSELQVEYCNRSVMSPYASKETYVRAKKASAVIVCVGNDRSVETEGRDRASIKLHADEEKAINRLATINENVIVVVYAGSAIDVSGWIDSAKAVVWAGFSGEGVNEALADILTGKVCPSGKLAETLPTSLEDTYCGSSLGSPFVERYDDGIFVGYRYYDAADKEVAFPFGFGLSYAEFEYSDLAIEKKGELDYAVSFNVKNVSGVDGKEVSQVYVKDVFATVARPEKELKGFSKDLVKSGETVRVTVPLNARSFAYYNTAMKKWMVENGEFEILVCSSSREVRLKASIFIDLPEETQQSVYYLD